MNHKTTVKLVWTLVVIVLLIGVMRLVMVSNSQRTGDQKVLIEKSK